MEKVLTIDKVDTKRSGISDGGRAWSIYEVHSRDAEGKPLTADTFDAAWAGAIGKTVSVEVKVSKRGQFTNFTLPDYRTATVWPSQTSVRLPIATPPAKPAVDPNGPFVAGPPPGPDSAAPKWATELSEKLDLIIAALRARG